MTTPTRDPDSIALEAEYWQQVLALLGELNETVMATASEVMAASVAGLEHVVGARPLDAVELQTEALRQVLRRLRQIQYTAGAVLDLAGGRIVPMRAEAGLEPLDPEQ